LLNKFRIMLRVYSIQAGGKRLDVSPNTLTLEFSQKHMSRPLAHLEPILARMAVYKYVKKTSIRISLGKKRNNISRALLETKKILQAIAAA